MGSENATGSLSVLYPQEFGYPLALFRTSFFTARPSSDSPNKLAERSDLENFSYL